MQHFFRYQFPAIAAYLTIFFASSLPGKTVSKYIFTSDKIIHAGVFFVLCWLTHRALKFQSRFFFTKRSLSWGFFFTIMYGIIDEIHQAFVPGRSSGIDDIVADILGALLYVMLYRWRMSKKATDSATKQEL